MTRPAKKLLCQSLSSSTEEQPVCFWCTMSRSKLYSHICIYLVDSKKSFDDIQEWRKEAREHGNADQIYLVVGNKTDLKSK